MTTLFSHFLAQALGCSSIEPLHNAVRSRLMFAPGHTFSQSDIDAFILHGTLDEDALMHWAMLLKLSPQLLADAASLCQRAAEQQQKKLPELYVSGVGTLANLEDDRRVQVCIRVQLADHPNTERLQRSGSQWFERQTGYTVADLNRPGAFERILSLANMHWQQLEQWTGVAAERIEVELSA